MAEVARDVASCPHCGAAVEGAVDAYCCGGCELAAQIISGAGLDRYYEEREAFAPRPEGRRFDAQSLPIAHGPDGCAEVVFALDGLRCASCTWVTERVLERTPGVVDAHVSYASGRATVRFDPSEAQVEGIVQRVAALGYRPRPAQDALRGDRDLLVRTGLAAFVAGNVMLLSASIYAGWWEGIAIEHAQLLRWTQLVLATPAVLYAAVPFFRGAWSGLKAGLLHMDLPISIAVAALYLHGVGAVFVHSDGYLDSLTMLIALLLGGRLLEARGRKRAGEAAAALASRLPTRARRRTPVGVEEVAVEALQIGDLIEIGAGEDIPADGRIVEGSGLVQMAMITGEAAPAQVEPCDRIVAGAVVEVGALTLRVEAVGAETVGAHMARQLQAATDRGSDPTAADRLAPWFVGLTLIIAAVTFGVWSWISEPGVALQVTVAVLVTACPCALGLSGPLATAAGLGAAARRGAVLRSGASLLALAEVDTVALDKTGTVTGGVPEVVGAQDAVLRIAAGLERHSGHPIGRAIVREATERGIPLPIGARIRERAGEGIEGRVDGILYRISAGEPGEVVVSRVLEALPGELSRVGVQPIGTIQVRDRRRDDARDAVEGVRGLGLHPAVLTGDRAEIAMMIGEEAGVTDIEARLDPEAKVRWIKARQAQGHRVLFVGDGLNDGPALAAADVGLAMGAGATSSVLVADGVVAYEELGPVPAAIRVARAAKEAVRKNVRRSVVYNVLAVTAAALGLVNPLIAAILMPLSSAWVIAGALGVERRVRRQETRHPKERS